MCSFVLRAFHLNLKNKGTAFQKEVDGYLEKEDIF